MFGLVLALVGITAVEAVKKIVEIYLARPFQGTSFFETAMATLFHNRTSWETT